MGISDDEWLQAVGQIVREVVLLTHSPDSCIFSTRVARGVLRRYGIDGEPYPCNVILCNRAAIEVIGQLGALPPLAEQSPDVHTVGLGVGDDAQVGHLCIRIRGRGLLDPSLDQAHRPHRHLHANEVKWLPFSRAAHADDRSAAWTWCTGEDRTAAWYWPTERRSWRGSPDWNNSKRYRPSVAEGIERVEALLSSRA